MKAFECLLWLPPSSMIRTLAVVLPISAGGRKNVTVHVCVGDVLVFPRLVQTVAQLRVALGWEIDSEGVGNV